MNPDLPENQPSTSDQVTQPAKRRHFPRLLPGCVLTFVLLTFAAVCLPIFNSVAVRTPQTRALAQAKQIGLALKIFAGDNDGKYPGQGVPVEWKRPPTNSDVAFATLFPTYTTSERIFGNPLSAYQTRPPDDVIDIPSVYPPVKTLEPGENAYAYVAGLTDKSDPTAPLVLDGTDGTGLYYNNVPTTRGGVWEGKRAIVIHLDNSGAVETLTGRANTRYIPSHVPGRPANALDLSWLGPDAHLLNPAVAP